VIPLVRAFRLQAEGPGGSAKGIPVEKSPHSPFFVRLVKKPHFFYQSDTVVRTFGRPAEAAAKAIFVPLIHLFLCGL
jgi:hypothetical protein